MKGSKSLLTLGLALACAAITFSLTVCAEAQILHTIAFFNGLNCSSCTISMTTTTGPSVEAKFTVESDTYIKATVPTGATTGMVSVVTPSGALNSNPQFRVTK
jgi:hypothetical protein